MKPSKQKTFEEWMGELVVCPDFLTKEKRRNLMSIPRYNFAKEVWAAAGGEFDGDDITSKPSFIQVVLDSEVGEHMTATVYSDDSVVVKGVAIVPREHFEACRIASGKFKSDEVNDEAN